MSIRGFFPSELQTWLIPWMLPPADGIRTRTVGNSSAEEPSVVDSYEEKCRGLGTPDDVLLVLIGTRFNSVYSSVQAGSPTLKYTRCL